MFSKIAALLARAEQQISELALLVLDERQPRSDRAAIKNQYPTQFDLFTAEELAKTIAQFQGILAAAGNAPSARNPIPASWPALPTKPRPHRPNRSRPSRDPPRGSNADHDLDDAPQAFRTPFIDSVLHCSQPTQLWLGQCLLGEHRNDRLLLRPIYW